MKALHRFSSTGLIALSFGATVSHAQQAAPEYAALEEIVVTATKRAENLQDVPLSVRALTGVELERRGATMIEDALLGEASVLIVGGGQAVNRNVSIRGVSDIPGGLTQSTVAIYVDEMPTTAVQANGNVSLALYDIDDVTVIRGPRSTLYGSASLGGTIKIQTRNPNLEQIESNVGIATWKTADSDDLSTDAHGSVSFPVREGVAALGVTAYRIDQVGYVDSATLGEDIDDTRTVGGRVALRVKPTDELDVVLKFYYQNIDGDSSSVFDPFTHGLRSPTAQVIEQPWEDQVRAATLTLSYAASSFDVISATSRLDKDASYRSDVTGFFAPLLGFPPSVTLALNGQFNSVITSQELRAVSRAAATGWNWSVGAFYSKEDTDNLGSTPSPIGELFGSDTRIVNEQKAAFGEIGYKWANGFGATAGMRYTKYDSDSKVNLLGLFALPVPVNEQFGESPSTPHFALSYATGGQNYYVQASRGFRLGKVNFPVIPVPGIPVPAFAASDTLWTYEIGAKTEWLDRRLTVNTAAYYTDWSNPQLTLTLPTGFRYVNSLGALNPGAGIRVIGGEIEVSARPTRALTLSAGLGLTDSEFTDDVIGVDSSGAVTPSGTRVAAIPKITANAAVRYEFPLGRATANVGANAQHVGDYASTYGPLAADIGDYTSVDLRAGFDLNNWSVTAFLTNAGNERPELTRTFFGPAGYASTIRPRSFGLSAGYRF